MDTRWFDVRASRALILMSTLLPWEIALLVLSFSGGFLWGSAGVSAYFFFLSCLYLLSPASPSLAAGAVGAPYSVLLALFVASLLVWWRSEVPMRPLSLRLRLSGALGETETETEEATKNTQDGDTEAKNPQKSPSLARRILWFFLALAPAVMGAAFLAAHLNNALLFWGGASLSLLWCLVWSLFWFFPIESRAVPPLRVLWVLALLLVFLFSLFLLPPFLPLFCLVRYYRLPILPLVLQRGGALLGFLLIGLDGFWTGSRFFGMGIMWGGWIFSLPLCLRRSRCLRFRWSPAFLRGVRGGGLPRCFPCVS